MKEQLDFKEKKHFCEQNMKWNMVNTRHICSLTHTSEMTEICIKQKKNLFMCILWVISGLWF